MKKYIGKIIIGSALCASSIAFAGESASTTMVLSDQQMDTVTAGTGSSYHPSTSSFSWQSISQTQGNTTNVNVSPTVGLNLAVLTFGGSQTVRGGNTYQSGGTQIAYIRH
jgi:hypothetical protein